MYIYAAEEIRSIDQEAERSGLPLFTLMENAGRSLFEKVKEKLDRKMTIGIVCGRGNNGGDGIVLARYLQNEGYKVTLHLPLGEPKSTVAKEHLHYYKALGYKVTPWRGEEVYDCVIDALLGVGTRLPLEEKIQQVLRWANRLDCFRIAVDLPTGVLANSGEVTSSQGVYSEGAVFCSNYTISLHGFKPSRFLYPATNYYGEVDVVTIGLPRKGAIRVLQENEVKRTLPSRPSDGHKGTFGTGLIIAGTDEMPGSVALSAIGAIRSGIGKLIVATEKDAIPIVANHVPEATFIYDGLNEIAEGKLPEKLASASIGPGLVDRPTIERALKVLFTLPIPIVLDAGALDEREAYEATGPVIVTPHPGEFSRMTGYSTKAIAKNRISLAKQYAETKEVIVILKGAYTVIAFPDGEVFINETGNTGLAKGGSGDVLTGILTSFLATHDSVKEAVKNAVYIHGLCADYWAQTYSEHSMVARDFASLLPKVMEALEGS